MGNKQSEEYSAKEAKARFEAAQGRNVHPAQAAKGQAEGEEGGEEKSSS